MPQDGGNLNESRSLLRNGGMQTTSLILSSPTPGGLRPTASLETGSYNNVFTRPVRGRVLTTE